MGAGESAQNAPERVEMNKADKRLNILGESTFRAPRLLAAHIEFRDEI